MEHQKALNLLNEAIDSKFVTRKWNVVNDQSKASFDVGNKPDLCHYNDAYILVLLLLLFLLVSSEKSFF